MRVVALIPQPSTRQPTIRTRSALLNLFINTLSSILLRLSIRKIISYVRLAMWIISIYIERYQPFGRYANTDFIWIGRLATALGGQ